MKTLSEVKHDYAKSVDYSCWGEFLHSADKADLNMALSIVSENYAKEFAKAELEKVREEINSFNTAMTGEALTGFSHGRNLTNLLIDKKIKEL